MADDGDVTGGSQDLEDFEIDQTRRILSVDEFPLGAQKVIAVRFEGLEALSTMSRFRVELVTKGRSLKPGEVLGGSMRLTIRYRQQSRSFSGLISRIEVLRTNYRGFFLQVLELTPHVFSLTLNRRCRIFEDTSATDIVSKVLEEGSIDAQVKSVGEAREYWVQYGESDFAFVSRLLEEQGLFYRFDHSQASTPLIVGDGSGDYVGDADGSLKLFDRLESWQPQFGLGPSDFSHTAWDCKAVSRMDAQASGKPLARAPGAPSPSVFEYPGRHETAGEGARLARARMDELDAETAWIAGSSDICLVETARKIQVEDHPTDLPSGQTDTFVVIRVEHRASDYHEMPFSGDESYRNDFYCIPAELDWRPPRVTPTPRIQGPQTATVTDAPDDQGRAKVKFHWEENGVSRWARVAQVWAYNAMGSQYLPRIDSEVVVDFLDGDPDQPLIVGMVYNGRNKLLYDTPANKTQSGLRGANWGDPGVPDQSNELRFEDKSGEEEIYVHAQRDFRRVVVNDDALTVQQGNRTLRIQQGDVSETLDQGNKSTRLSQGNQTISLEMGDQTTTLSMGDHKLSLEAGASTTEAMQSITLKVGGSSIVIDQTGVTIQGMMVTIQADATLDASSPMTSIEGDATLTLNGGMVMIN